MERLGRQEKARELNESTERDRIQVYVPSSDSEKLLSPANLLSQTFQRVKAIFKRLKMSATVLILVS